MANYRSLAAFAQFGTSDLDRTTRRQIERGQIMTEVLKQPQYNPLPVEEEVAILWAGTSGRLDDVPVDRVREFEAQYLEYLRSSHADLLKAIVDEKKLSDEIVAQLEKATSDFKSTNDFGATEAASASA
jgi:F-type H+-transporting ATPase subunit alpha